MGKLRSVIGGALGTFMLALGVSVYVQKSREEAPEASRADPATPPLRFFDTSAAASNGGEPAITGGITPVKPALSDPQEEDQALLVAMEGPLPRPETWDAPLPRTGEHAAWDPASPQPWGAQTTALRTGPGGRYHKVADGDTLERIAERYLGDRRLADSIFLANRHVLIRRDLLPLGMTLTIPPPPPADSRDAPSIGAGDAQLVPVPRDNHPFPGHTVSSGVTAVSEVANTGLVKVPSRPPRADRSASPTSRWRRSEGP